MKPNEIIEIISSGNTKQALKELQKGREQLNFREKIELDTISARFNSLSQNIHNNLISFEEGQRESSRINAGLLTFLNSKILQEDSTIDDTLSQISKLGEDFNHLNQITNTASRLREKNQITRKICQYLIEEPHLQTQLLSTNNQGIISGLAFKIRTIPDVELLSILDKITSNAKSNFPKGNIVNAIAEIVYSGQMRMGDDVVITSILERLSIDADLPLKKNIERVEVALKYLIQNNK